MYRRNFLALAALSFGLSACSSNIATLSPAPGSNTVPGVGDGAAANVDGVRIVARAQAWQWNPADLTTKVTPLLIELHNDGTRPISVRYNHLSLTDADGHVFHVMPPYDIDGTITQAYTIDNPYYGFNRFSVAPYLSRWYPRFTRFNGAFAYDGSYYSPYFTAYQHISLPTPDMVQRALPEGVLEAGGSAMGFVYFEALHRDARTLTLSVDIVDATSGATVGTARIPFVAK